MRASHEHAPKGGLGFPAHRLRIRRVNRLGGPPSQWTYMASILAACGCPGRLIERSDGTLAREEMRRFLHSTISPAARIAGEMAVKPLTLRTWRLTSRIFSTLIGEPRGLSKRGGGIHVGKAAALAGSWWTMTSRDFLPVLVPPDNSQSRARHLASLEADADRPRVTRKPSGPFGRYAEIIEAVTSCRSHRGSSGGLIGNLHPLCRSRRGAGLGHRTMCSLTTRARLRQFKASVK